MIKYIFTIFLISSVSNASDVFNMTFLGTGTPRPNIEKLGPSLLIKNQDQQILIDIGRGTSLRLSQIGNDYSNINEIYISHFHFDHVIGLADFWLTSNLWQKKSDTFVYGPIGVNAFCKNIMDTYKMDLKYRYKDRKYSKLNCLSFKNKKPVLNEEKISIQSFANNHGHIDNSYGFKIKYKGKNIVYSGDTTLSENVIKNAKGADILIHEIFASSKKIFKSNKKLREVASTHTTLDQMISVLKQTNPKLTILTHALLFGINENDVLKVIEENYNGDVIFAKDLMSVDIGKEINIFNLEVLDEK